MKKSLLIIAAMAAISSSVFAAGNGNGNNGNGNPPVLGPTIPGTGGPMNYAIPYANNNPVAHGGTGIGVGVGVGVGVGNGGQGGNGGNATGGNATGGSVIGSGNSANNNTNLNNNTQGQQQAAIAGASSSSSSSSSAGATSSSGGNTLTGGTQSAAQDNRVSNTINGDTVTYQAQERNPVSTAYAPMIAPTAACALGTSIGIQAATVGASFGTANIDANCQLLEQVRSTATVLGDRVTAAEMMCDVPAYKAARARTGKPCSGDKTASAGAAPALASLSRDEGVPVPLLP